MWGSKGDLPPCTPKRGSAPSNPAGGFIPRAPLKPYHFKIPSDGPGFPRVIDVCSHHHPVLKLYDVNAPVAIATDASIP